MKNLYCALLACLLLGLPAMAQRVEKTVRFRSGALNGRQNIQRSAPANWQPGAHFGKNNYVLLRFGRLPDAARRSELRRQGITLFDYIPGNAFFAELPDQLSLRTLEKYTVDAVYVTDQSLKLSRALLQPADPALTGPGQYFAVHYFGSLPDQEVIAALVQAGARISQQKIRLEKAVLIEADTAVLKKISALPFVSYIHEQTIRDQALNNHDREAHGAATLGLPQGRNLQGKNVVVGIGDQGEPAHIDLSARLINRNPTGADYHGLHTAGTVAGAGHMNPLYKGMAPKATLISQYFSNILVNTPLYGSDYGMVLTNNSYESSMPGCGGNGVYDALSNYVDAQQYSDISLLHVFAAGNSGTSNCLPYPASFHTVRSGFQSSKNSLMVGNMNAANDTIADNSSRGPVDDGRLKPEIVAGGTYVMSTSYNNGYGISSGTSMAAPAVTGTLALLYERYRQLNGGANPPAALIKAAACNTAVDMGNKGPDFKYGFGRLNAVGAVETLEENRYFLNTIGQGINAIHTIPAIPAGAAQLKVMLYWTDPPANPGAASTLINNLDLTVTGTDGVVHRPLILDPAAPNVNALAVEGTDNLNNIEQVVIYNPPAGGFTIRVNGSSIPFGPQPYVVVYQWLQPSVTLEYPVGSEKMVPGETEYIRWTAYDASTNDFTLEYSSDNGGTWNTISDTVPGTARLLAWTVPDIATNDALVRVSRNTATATSQPFLILDTTRLVIAGPCPGYAQLIWSAVAGATSYEILQLIDDSMAVVGNTNVNSYLLSGLDKTTAYRIAVRPVNGSAAGRASLAVSITPNGGNCNTNAFRNDLSLDTLLSPLTGRMHTASGLGISAPRVRIRNNGNIATSGAFHISYQVNSDPVVSESSTQAIALRSNFIYTFTQPYDFSNPGIYTVRCWVSYDNDTLPRNDTFTVIVKHLENDPVILNPSFTEEFETMQEATVSTPTQGFPGLDRLDFRSSTTNGRARSFVNTGFARSGNRALTLDQKSYSTTATADSATLTFNLSNYSAADQLWLDFYYRNQGIDFSLDGNGVWIRGNDSAAWIPVFTLPPLVEEFGIYKPAKSININETLANAIPAQTISSSFQIRFGAQGYTSASSVAPPGNLEDGITYDDVILTRASNDVGITAILSPTTTGVCTLSANEAITLELNNYSSATLSNVEVSYKLDGHVVTENISLAPGTGIPFTFAGRADLSALGEHRIEAWVHYSSDNYSNNDTIPETVFHTTPLISSFPYLQKFDTSGGYWFSQGSASSWAWGAPSKPVINKGASGINAWATGLAGGYNDNELSYLYSPCFDLTGMAHPVLSFSHIFQIEDNCDCDYHWVEYSTDGTTWSKLGAYGEGTNWYNNAAKQAWQISNLNWHVASIDIPVSNTSIRFRFVMKSDPGSTRDGVGIDDVHIFDKTPVYTGASITSGLSQAVSGTGWHHFDVSGQRVASIDPQGQDLGTVEVKAFIYPGPVRNQNGQYYLDRNIVIQASNPPSGNVLVRYYFTNDEAVNLLLATGCDTCTKPIDPYEAGVTQYSGNNENGSLEDNDPGINRFHRPWIDVGVVPYDNGYYAQYSVNRFSEFWINGGGLWMNEPLPVVLSSFTATRKGRTALLQWTTSQEQNSHSFIIEKSTDGSRFTPIGTVMAAGNSSQPLQYSFTDQQLGTGISYYRLALVDIDGTQRYSVIRILQADNEGLVVRYYPNPAYGSTLYIETNVDAGRIELTDLRGRLLRTVQTQGRLHTLPLTGLAKGTYFVTVHTIAGRQVEKIVVGAER